MSTKVVQITNIAPQATKDQMQSLFGCVGRIDEIRLYPTVRDVTCPVSSRVCYIKFFESSCVAVAQHLTNTTFIDRALMVCPVTGGAIPDEFKALEIINNGTGVPGLQPSDVQLPPEVENRVEGTYPSQIIKTADPKLEELELPEYPALPITTEPRRIEEIRRTIIVIDIPSDWELREIIEHFEKHAGEVKCARFAEKSRQKHAMVEFCEQKTVPVALKMQGTDFLGDPLNIYHSMQNIIKPEAKSNEAAQREIEEAMSFVKESQHMITAATLDPIIGLLSQKEKPVVVAPPMHVLRLSRSKSRRSSRSPSRAHSRRSRSKKRTKRSRSRSYTRRRRSRSRSKRRSRSRSKRPRSRDRERDRRRRSRSRRRSRTPSPPRRRPSRERSERSERQSRDRRDRERRDRDRDRDRERDRDRDRDRERERDRDKERRVSKSPARTKKSSRKDKEEKKSRRSRSRSKSREKKSRRKEPKEEVRVEREERDDKEKERSSRREKRDKSRERSRSKERKQKRASGDDEKPSHARDYDAEERIGLNDDSSKRGSSDEASEKSDNMDIANSP